MTETAVLQIITLVGGAIAYSFQVWKQSRHERKEKAEREQTRQWALDDEMRRAQIVAADEVRRAAVVAAEAARVRDEASRDRRDLVETLVASVRRNVEREGKVSRREIRKVHTDLAANTAINAEALSAANHVNLKLAQMTHALREALADRDPKTSSELQAIEVIVSDLEGMRERLAAGPVATPDEKALESVP